MGDDDRLVRLVKSADFDEKTDQTAGMLRRAGVDAATIPGASIWLGRVTGQPGMVSAPHHHGHSQTAGYVLSGIARIYYGELYEDYVDVHEGDMVYIPAHVPHIESNALEDRPVEFVTARHPDNTVVNLELPFGWRPRPFTVPASAG